MFSDFVIAYLFLGGTGGGALVVLALLECANAPRRYFAVRVTSGLFSRPGEFGAVRTPTRGQRLCRLFYLPGDVLKNAWIVCASALALGILFLFMDLGHPDRVFALLAHPNLSAITVGAYALIFALVCAGAFCILALADVPAPNARGIRALAALGIAAGAAVILYTGILLTQAVSVLFWMTPLVPALFCLSSLSGGIACVMLGAAFAAARQASDRVLVRLARIDTALIACEALALASWIIWGLATPGPDESAKALVAGPLGAPFWLGLVAAGLAAPAVLEQLPDRGGRRTQTLAIAVLVLFGGAMLRVCVVGAGSFDVTQTGAYTALIP